MDEYNGPRTLIDKEGQEHPLPDYVHWLEDRLAALTAELLSAQAKIISLQRQSNPVRHTGDFSAFPRIARVHGDYDDYSDHLPCEDDDR